MKKEIVGIFVCMLLITTIIPVSTATDTDTEYNTFEITDAKIFIRGRPQAITIAGGLYLIISPIFINAIIWLEFPLNEIFPKPPKVIMNGERLTIEEPVKISMENFTGFGTPAFTGLFRTYYFLILRYFLFGVMYIGRGDITITPLE